MKEPRGIARVSLLVKDYDEAIDFYAHKLGFSVLEDTPLGSTGKRWVVIGPTHNQGAQLLLAQADGAAQASTVGQQAGGRVFLFLFTDDFWRDYNKFRNNGVIFRETPRREAYGTVAVFEDLYGNLWDLLEPQQ